MRVHRFQSPFKHWLTGLAVEAVAFISFMVVVAVVAAMLVRFL